MSNVPTNLIPTRITGLPEYLGSSTLGYMPYIIDGRTYKVQFANIAAVGAVPSTREINTGSGLGGGGDLSANRTLFILPGGVDDSRLSVTGVVAGTYGAADSVPVFTVNAQGRVTGVTDTPIVLSNYVPTSRTITAGAGLTGGGDLSANRSFAVNFSSTTPEPLGPGSSGVSTVAAREDHVHPAVDLSDTTETQGVLPLSRGGTGNSLSPVAGAIVYSSNDKLYLTTAGSVGQVLRSGGPGGVPFWTNVGAGTVTSVAVATANGFAGTVADPTLSPVITLSTTVTGLIKGNGTAISAAVAGTDYVEPGAYTTSGLTMATARLLGRTTASVGAAQEITVGNGLTLSSGSLVNAAPDQTVSLTAGTAISVTGTYPSFTVTNTAPDQVVSLTGAGTTTVTGTYPSFTITSNDSTSGTVTSVNASGGTTGMSFTGGPITSAGTLTLNGTLAVANGGTGATDAVAALTNLGAYPASNPSGFTSNVGTVTSVSGTGTVSGLSLSGTVTSAGSLTLGGTLAVTPSDFASQTANTVLAAPNGSAGVPTFRAIVAADIPTLNQNTTGTAGNVSGIVAVANGGTGASVASTARTNLSAAASGANTDITSIALTTGTISTSPVSGTDIVNKAYADSIASGINFHQSVRLATAAALPANTYNNGTSGVGATLTANANGALTVDGVAAVAGNRILVKDEVAGANNGVYVVTQVGNGSTPYILTRATDFDSAGTGVDQIDAGDFFLVTAGSTLANTSWVQQTPLPITVGTTAIVFSQFAAPVLYSAGTGLSLAGTVFSITNTGVSASTYGSASSVPVIAVNAQGQITSASSSNIAIAASQITSGALAIANGGTGATDASGALSNLGAYPASNPSGFTSNTGTVTSVNLTAGTGVSVSGGPITASGSITVTNTAPDQVVSLTGSGATTVTGTYPNFTISSPTAGAGTVTSIDVSGGTTGLTTSGGPVTSSGTITLAGTLNVANGGTGATTLSSGYLVKGNGTSAVSASVVYDDGTNAMIGTTTALGRLTIQGNTNANLDAWIRNDNAGSSSRAGLVLNASGNSWRMGMGSTANNSNALTWNVDIGGANTEYMRLTTGGNLGIGTSSPATKLEVADSGTVRITALNTIGTVKTQLLSDSTSGYVGTDSNHPLSFFTNQVVRATINTSGSVTANVDIRAPIFYDSDNTAYYINGAGNSVLNTLYMRNGSIEAKFAQASQFGYSSSYRTVVLGNEYLTTISMGVDVSGNASGSFNGQGEGREVIFRNGVNFITPNSANNSYLTPLTLADGYAASTGSFRAPIFYDSDNTAYYVDPASGSNLTGQVQINGGTTMSGGWNRALYLASQYPVIVMNSGSVKYSGIGVDYTEAQSGMVFWVNGNSADITNGSATAALRINTGNFVVANDVRATIFYDSNNSAYYLDPASGSRLGGQVLFDGGTVIQGNGDVYSRRSSGTTGVYYFADGGSKYLFWDGGAYFFGSAGYTQSDVSMRAPIFYDSANTARYFDGTTGINFTTGSSSRVTVYSDDSGLHVANSEGVGGDVRLGAAYNLPGLYNNPNLYLQSESGIYFHTGNTQRGYFDGSSNLFANGSMRAPIFYDSNNTGYYLDAASTTSLRTVGSWRSDSGAWDGEFNGKIQYHANNWYFQAANAWLFRRSDANTAFSISQAGEASFYGAIATISNYSPANYAIRLTPNMHINAVAGNAVILNWDNGTTTGLTFRIGNGAGSDVFTTYANGATYAPIYYDINNSAFYFDGASTTNINVLSGNGKTILETADGYLRINQSNTFTNGMWMGNSNFGGGAGTIHLGSAGDPTLSRIRIIGGTYNGSTVITLNGADGSITAAGNITAFSDIRVKDNVETIPNALDKLDHIRGVTYTRTDREDKERRYAGVIAQEIEQVLPEAIFDNVDYKSVDYNATIGLLIQAVKELRDEVEALRK